MPVEDAYMGWGQRRLPQEAADLLGVRVRSFRRHIDRYEDGGLDGWNDKCISGASRRRAPLDESLVLKAPHKERDDDWNVKRYQERQVGQHSYTWVKNCLPKELTEADMAETEATNCFLRQQSSHDFNARFAVEDAVPSDAVVPLLGTLLDDKLNESRAVNRDKRVSYRGKMLQTRRMAGRRHYVTAQVMVHDHEHDATGIVHDRPPTVAPLPRQRDDQPTQPGGATSRYRAIRPWRRAAAGPFRLCPPAWGAAENKGSRSRCYKTGQLSSRLTTKRRAESMDRNGL